MTKEPKISVIIPVFNAGAYLERAIQSILNQTYQNIELICVDDCSTDDSVSKIKKLQQKDKRIRLILNKVNQGPGPSCDNGIDNAKGKYITFIDIDDLMDTGAIEKLYHAIIKHRVSVVFANYYKTTDGTSEKITVYQGGMYHVDKTAMSLFISPWGKIYEKSFLNKNGIRFGNYRVADDRFFLCQIYSYADQIYFLPDFVYFWYTTPNSITQTKSSPENPKFFIALEVADKCHDFLMKHKPEIWNPDFEMYRLLDYCQRIHPRRLREFIRALSEIVKKWDLKNNDFSDEEARKLWVIFCKNKYYTLKHKLYRKNTYVKYMLKAICFLIPVRKWRKKIRSIYR